MSSAKSIIIKSISAAAASKVVKQIHYSGKTAAISQLHLGVFLNDSLEGVMQFGPPIDRRKLLPLVKDTKFNDFLELNRMAFSDKLPRNSESRAMAIAFKLIKKNYPHIEWIISFADGTQCGDGTIYRAAGFLLTQIKKNTTIKKLADGTIAASHGTSKKDFTDSKTLDGFQLRYIYFLNKEAQSRLTVPIIPFSKIDEMGATMYKGQRSTRDKQAMDATSITAAVQH
jgi:hypothetical protein